MPWGFGDADPGCRGGLGVLTGVLGCRCLSPRGAGVPSRVLGLELHLPGRELLVAFAGCLLRLPLSRCGRHSSCRG